MPYATCQFLAQQALYNRLDALSPVFEGPWRWAMFAAIAVPVLVIAWALLGRRWRPDGVRRCPRCAHEFDPTASFAAPEGVRCGECGAVTHDARRALRRRGRWAVAAIAAASAVVLATPYLLWQGAHAVVAAVLLPRWVACERAAPADGIVVVHQVDPVHAWLGWDPPAGGPPRWANRYPGWRDSERVMVGVPGCATWKSGVPGGDSAPSGRNQDSMARAQGARGTPGLEYGYRGCTYVYCTPICCISIYCLCIVYLSIVYLLYTYLLYID